MKILKIMFAVSIFAMGALFLNMGKDGRVELASDAAGWTQTSGPLGGTVIRMINNNGKIWASLYSGGIYELQSNGKWKQIAIGHGIPENRAFDIAVDPKNAKIAYVPEMVGCGGKTTDGGANWTGLCDEMLPDIEADNFSSHTVAIDPDDSNKIYMPGHTHDQTSMFLTSTDAGVNWSITYTFDTHYDFNHLFFFGGKMYLGTLEDGVFVSSDKGKTWTAFNMGLSAKTTTRFFTFKNSLYLLGSRLQFNTRDPGYLYKLSANGAKWEKASSMSNLTGAGTDGTTLFVGDWDGKVYSSTDGATFKKVGAVNAEGLIGEIAVLNSKIYVGSAGNGVFVSTNTGKTFKEYNTNMPSVATREVYVNPKDSNEIYVGTWDRLGFYMSRDGGKVYKRMATDMNILVMAVDPNNFANVYLGGDRFSIGNVSGTGTVLTERVKPGSANGFLKALTVDPQDSRHLLAGVASEVAETPPGEGLWESKDQGKTWKRSSGIGDFAVYSIIFHPSNPKIVYASALSGGVYKSKDGGTKFTQIGGDSLKYTYRLAMSPTDPNILVASSNVFFGQLSTGDQVSGKYGGIFMTKDAGINWTELTSGIRDYDGEEDPAGFQVWMYNFGHLPNYENILIDPNDSNHLIVGHHGENVVVTTDGGKTWLKPTDGMIPNNIHNYSYCLGASADFKKVYSCTCGRGLFSGVVNSSGTIAWDGGAVAYANESEAGPKNAKEALDFILSGEYNHPH